MQPSHVSCPSIKKLPHLKELEAQTVIRSFDVFWKKSPTFHADLTTTKGLEQNRDFLWLFWTFFKCSILCLLCDVLDMLKTNNQFLLKYVVNKPTTCDYHIFIHGFFWLFLTFSALVIFDEPLLFLHDIWVLPLGSVLCLHACAEGMVVLVGGVWNNVHLICVYNII